jgi:hypothetical protein
LVLVNNSESLCCGSIGGSKKGIRWCSKKADECTTKTHQNSKIQITSESIYLLARPGVALLSPKLAIEDLPVDTTPDYLLQEAKPMEVWKAYFENAKIRAIAEVFGEENVEDEEDFEIVDTLDEASKSFQSPAKRFKFSAKPQERESLFEGEDEGNVAYIPGNEGEVLTFAGTKFEYVNELPQDGEGNKYDVDHNLSFVSAQWNKVAHNFEAFHLAFIRERKIHNHLQSKTDQMFDEVKEQLNNMDGRTRLLSSRIGQPGGEGDAQSLWEHLEETQRDLMDTQMVLHKTKHRANEFEKFERSTETRLNNVELKCKESGDMEDNVKELRNNHRLFVQKYQEFVANMSHNVQALNTKLKRKAPSQDATGKRRDTAQVPGSWSGSVGAGLDDFRYDVDKIRREVLDIERRSDTKMRTEIGDLKLWTLGIVDERTDQGGAAALSTPLSSQPLPSGLATDVASLGIGLAALSERVKDLKGGSTGPGEYYKSLQFSWDSYGDFKTWIRANPAISVGNVWDLFSVLVDMTPTLRSGKERSDEHHSASRAGTTKLESDLMATMTHQNPPLLFGKPTGSLGQHKEGFGAYATYMHWIGTGLTSFKTTLIMQLSDQVKALNGQMNEKPTSPAFQLAVNLLSQIIVQLNQVVGFVEQTQLKLTQVAQFSTKSSWTLNGRFCGAIFEAMRPFRSRIALIGDVSTLENKASVIWSVLQCHRIFKTFSDLQFEGHTAMVKEMSLFMLTERVDPAEVDKIREVMTKTVEANKKQQVQLAEQAELIASLKRDLGNLATDVKNLKQKK